MQHEWTTKPLKLSSVTSRRSLRFLCLRSLCFEVSFSYILFDSLFTLAEFTCGWILRFSCVGRLSRVSSSENWWASRRHIIVDLTIGWLFPWRQNDGMTGYGNFHAFFRIGDLERWILRILNFVNAYVSIARRKNCATLKLCVNGNWLSFQKLFNFCKIYGLYLYLWESEIDYFRYCKTVTFFLRFSNLFARFEWIAQIFSRFKRLLKTLYNQLLSFQNFKRLIF